jgi:hypothetical protein
MPSLHSVQVIVLAWARTTPSLHSRKATFSLSGGLLVHLSNACHVHNNCPHPTSPSVFTPSHRKGCRRQESFQKICQRPRRKQQSSKVNSTHSTCATYPKESIKVLFTRTINGARSPYIELTGVQQKDSWSKCVEEEM